MLFLFVVLYLSIWPLTRMFDSGNDQALFESDILARVEAAENKITKDYGFGNIYYGQMKSGWFTAAKRHGYGTLTYSGGSKYVGEYKDGKQDGQGTLTLADGTIEHSVEWEIVLENRSDWDYLCLFSYR